MTEPTDPALEAALVLLTLLTGDEWTRDRLIQQAEGLKQVAVQTLSKKGILGAEAEAIVEERWSEYGSPVAQEAPESSGERHTGPIVDLSPGTPPTHDELRSSAADRIARWRKDRAGVGEDPGSNS